MTKLVEVALPLEEISKASRRDKDRKVGTIKNVHKWFAPMPTPAWRALLFASLVDAPDDEAERADLLEFVKELVPEDGTAPAQKVLDEAHARIVACLGPDLPTVYDPFCGGGSTLVEAQRLGLPAAGSDLNPVPVLITRVLTELVPQVAGRPPLMGDPKQLKGMAGGRLDGFLADCRYYAERVRDEVWAEVGHLYPEAPGGGTVIAWLWARTVTCPNPACRAVAPLVSSFWLSKKKGALAWVEPIPGGPGQPVTFEVRTAADGGPTITGTKAGRGGKFTCVTCGEPIPEDHVRAEGKARPTRLGAQLMATAVDAPAGRRYLGPADSPQVPEVERPLDAPTIEQPDYARWFSSPGFGLDDFADLFTNRQLVMLGAFADAVACVPAWVEADGGDDISARSITSVLGLAVSKSSQFSSVQGRWWTRDGPSKIQPAFTRHALPMVWDFGEANPFGGSVGDWLRQVESMSAGLRTLPLGEGQVFQADARTGGAQVDPPVLVATDPPYFAHIGYADLSDYFYVWQRRALGAVHPDLFRTIATPKATELIAAPYRHEGGMKEASDYFVSGFTEVFTNLGHALHPELPMLIVYAHKQEDSSNDGVTSTAWDAMLTAIIESGHRIVGTWPVHATTSGRQIGLGANALASYVVLVCRPQEESARTVDLLEFRAALRAELPRAIRKLQEGAISSLDLGQAAIGPGMRVFSHFRQVFDPETGGPMPVHRALAVINQVQNEVLNEFAGEMDGPTRWAMSWYGERSFGSGEFDDAEKIFRRTTTSLDVVVRAGIATGGGGKVQLVARDDLRPEWGPERDRHVTVWEVANHLTQRLKTHGEQGAAALYTKCRRWGRDAFDLTYWLANLANEKGRTADALDYDALVTSWPAITDLAQKMDDAPDALF